MMMALTNAEKQKRYRERQRLKRAGTGHAGNEVTLRAETEIDAGFCKTTQAEVTPLPHNDITKIATPRRIMAASGVLRGMSTSAAMLEAGINPRSQSPRAAIAGLVQLALRRAGATPQRIAKSHVALLEARDVVTVKRPDDSGNLVVVEERSQDDNASRRWATEHYYKLHGAYPQDDDAKGGASGPVAAIQINIQQSQHAQTSQTSGQFGSGITITVQPGNGHNGNGHNGNGHNGGDA